jgi:N-acetylmuramoyl-L-alanine amidase
LGLLLLMSVSAQAAQLKAIRLWASPDSTRIVLDLSAPVQHQVQVLENPNRIVIDINDSTRLNSLRGSREGKGVVQSVRTGVQPGGVLRVVLDVSSRVVPHTFTLSPNSQYGDRLVVDLDDQGAPSEDQALESISSSDPLSTAAPAVIPPPSAHVSTDIQAAQARVPSATSSQQLQNLPRNTSRGQQAGQPQAQPPLPSSQLRVQADQPAATAAIPPERNKEIVVAVDAGHGGEDTGARGPSGVLEKDVALSMARKLARLINEEPGMKAVLTRDGDYYIGLRERTLKARKAQADLFISIHADAFRDRDASGSSVYVLSQRGASSEHARALAARENASDLVGGVRLTGKGDRDAFLLSVLQDTSMEASFDIAGRVLDELKRINSLHKGEVQQAGFMVLKSPDIPSLLVETAYISNRKEERQLDSDKYQDSVTHALMRGIRGYFSSYRPGRTLAEANPNNS